MKINVILLLVFIMQVLTLKTQNKNKVQQKQKLKGKHQLKQKFNPGDYFKIPKVMMINIGEKYIAQQKRKMQLKEKQKVLSQLQQQQKLYLKVKYISQDEISEGKLQYLNYDLNENSLYFTVNEKINDQRSILGGINLEKVFDNQDDINNGKCCRKIKRIIKTKLDSDNFDGYCFSIDLNNQLWMICDQSQKQLEQIRYMLRTNVILNWMNKYNNNPSFLKK